MPAQRLGAQGLNIGRFDVLGFDSPNVPEFVGHVALAANDYPNYQGEEIHVAHMIPPFFADFKCDACQCHGTVGLLDEEQRQIETFILMVTTEYRAEEDRRKATGSWTLTAREQFRAAQYTICPHVRGPNEDRPFHRFNCAGFVYEAYLAADLDLLHIANGAVPTSSLAGLKAAYPHFATKLDDANFRLAQGLCGDEPWPVLLPGFILNAMVRKREEILAGAYSPREGDDSFPARPRET